MRMKENLRPYRARVVRPPLSIARRMTPLLTCGSALSGAGDLDGSGWLPVPGCLGRRSKLQYHKSCKIRNREEFMKFRANYRIPHQNWLAVLEKFSAVSPRERADAGEGVRLIGRWHDMSSRTGVAIV